MRGKPGFEVGNAVAGQRRYHESCGEARVFIELVGQAEQGRLVDQIDFVKHEQLWRTTFAEFAQNPLIIFGEPSARVDQYSNEIGVLRAG